MDQPEHDLRSFAGGAQATPRRLVSLIVVAGLHVLIIVALATGLAAQLMQKPPTDIATKVIQEKPPDQTKVPPPPPPEMVKPPPPFVPPPDINIQTPTVNPSTTIQSTSEQLPPPPKPLPSNPVAIGRPHVCGQKWYPALAVRLNHEGTTTLGFTVNTDGTISNVHVVNSSGHDELDQAAIECAGSWSNYKPAVLNGQPVAVPYKANVKWNLQGG